MTNAIHVHDHLLVIRVPVCVTDNILMRARVHKYYCARPYIPTAGRIVMRTGCAIVLLQKLLRTLVLRILRSNP